ncbi:axin isoform X1 [Aedes aegypti]|uniref:Putative regulator of g protein signaling n=1 Tax=Aedes aegypti TaxID=7159 RepID=A0A0P6ITN1_AEDAE|nr:axin isoform X1 [Aedes aegypti]XP_021709961.1 axin isoform X1 [Aedes aegypti]XP_021709962.1 axin isoform X1 [Aedes aegypti]XP_021709963.1 axin isoform X1 [Aedes aegypti]XP_021709964.1 axin isoform X1 [Aedes aegypti]XP_021709965.1 axin isoform X1 [Aedes aegypti]XP_021709966.1 axin isoform X1 [Aedes aegypti]XP_021709967.1 axin isoform X1 [Aedes aegypti]XP_021709969.1 axin isoform X1 [Aedes aegypti]XP_021709970.1 axin isoform X1 [Aedes aegypti]
MSQYSSHKFDDVTCSGPRPPVPGEESRRKVSSSEWSKFEAHSIRSGSSSSFQMTDSLHRDKSRDSPPAYYRWADKLTNLLEDADGAELFKRFVELEGEEHSSRLKFYFACEGLKQLSDPEKVTQTIGAIYRRFLKRVPRESKLYCNDQIRNTIKAGLKNEMILTPDIFDQMQADVAAIISTTTYPNFLQSDLYIQYVQNMQFGSGSGSGGASCISLPAGIPAAGPSSVAAPGALSSLTSSSSTSELISHSSSALPTLHEDSELVNADSIEQLYGATGPVVAASNISFTSGVSGSGSSSGSNLAPGNKPAMTLTKDALIATQKRRLEMRPPGPHGFSVYTKYASYNPVSRRDSELASLSSGRTDSDKVSLPTSTSADGRPHSQSKHHYRHHTSIERRLMNENAIANEEPDAFAIIPRTHRQFQKPLPPDQFVSVLTSKLKMVQQERENKELLSKKLQEIEQSDKSQSNKFFADAIRQKLQVEDDSDQDILDKHVSRVWSDLTPSRSPGTMSPCPNISRARRHEVGGFGGGSMSAQSSMRHSKSMPEGHPMGLMGPPAQPRRLNNKWPSVYTDSGISLLSTDTLTKSSNADMQSASTSSSRPLSRTMHADMSLTNTATLLQESSRRLDDEPRRSKRYQHPLPPPPLPPPAASLPLVPPPIPAKPSSTSAASEFTVVVYSFCDEEVPYRIKIPGSQPPTLKQFKDYLPKKGNYRFFFKTRCDDLDSPVIQEEINNDGEMLPLFEGKVMGTVKPLD